MTRSVFHVESSERRSRSKPVARSDTRINARIVWAMCGVALCGAAALAWTVQAPEREAVVLSPQSQATPQVPSAPSMEQFPGLVSPPSMLVVAAPAAVLSLSPAQAGDLSRTRAEPADVTAGASSVPVSTWPAAVIRAPNEVQPRSDMRYQVNSSLPR